MTKTDTEIRELEKRLQLAELGPDPKFFDEALAEDAVLVSQDGAFITKTQIVGAHQPGKGPKFTRGGDERHEDH